MEEQFWVKWGSVFHRWGILPFSGGALEQPWIFWYFVDLIETALHKREEMEKYNDNIKRVDYKLEW